MYVYVTHGSACIVQNIWARALCNTYTYKYDYMSAIHISACPYEIKKSLDTFSHIHYYHYAGNHLCGAILFYSIWMSGILHTGNHLRGAVYRKVKSQLHIHNIVEWKKILCLLCVRYHYTGNHVSVWSEIISLYMNEWSIDRMIWVKKCNMLIGFR